MTMARDTISPMSCIISSMASFSTPVMHALTPLGELQQQILGDLDERAGGVGWWGDYLDDPRRILISDYLVELVDSTERNLVESSMHLSRAGERWFAEGQDLIRWFRAGNNGFPPPSENSENRRVEMAAHVVGFFRAIGTVFDNLAGVTIGVAGLRKKIVRADFTQLRLDEQVPFPGGLTEGTSGRIQQVLLATALQDCIRQFPNGWEKWALDMRNMLVHRARRLWISLSDPREADGFMRPLPAHPAQTDVESLARNAGKIGADLLHEDATASMGGALRAVAALVETHALASIALWERRRDDRSLIPQPIEQWPDICQGRDPLFTGFTSADLPVLDGGFMSVNPIRARRLVSARVLDDRRASWQEWLPQE